MGNRGVLRVLSKVIQVVHIQGRLLVYLMWMTGHFSITVYIRPAVCRKTSITAPTQMTEVGNVAGSKRSEIKRL